MMDMIEQTMNTCTRLVHIRAMIHVCQGSITGSILFLLDVDKDARGPSQFAQFTPPPLVRPSDEPTRLTFDAWIRCAGHSCLVLCTGPSPPQWAV